jgi:hypothetical protein
MRDELLETELACVLDDPVGALGDVVRIQPPITRH